MNDDSFGEIFRQAFAFTLAFALAFAIVGLVVVGIVFVVERTVGDPPACVCPMAQEDAE